METSGQSSRAAAAIALACWLGKKIKLSTMPKRLALILASSAFCFVSHGQGTIRFTNLGTGAGGTVVDFRFFDRNGPLSGDRYTVQLWYGPANTPPGSLDALNSPVLGFGTAEFAGYFSSAPTVQIPGVPPGAVATLQVRISIPDWEVRAPPTFRSELVGISNAFQSAPLGNQLNPTTIPVMQGLQSFFVVPPWISSVSVSGGNVTVNWTGGGTLETTGSLLNSGTVWTSTGDGDGSYTAPVGTGNAYFRVRRQ